ncbi:hypothetical protein ACNKHW_15595 [Shigella flexneri]
MVRRTRPSSNWPACAYANFSTWRPCDQVEAAVGWKLAVRAPQRTDGTRILFSQAESGPGGRMLDQVKEIARGGYVLKDSGGSQILF